MRLRHSVVDGPGLRRVSRGRGFGYRDEDGVAIADSTTLQRIEDLVIPPAWRKVWICPHPNGHIQAVGTDAAGRRQYIYHSQWQEDRSEAKFDRVLELSAVLADWRTGIASDLRRRGLSRDRVLALGLRLLDLGYFRAGGDQYAEENNSFGIATLLRDHITMRSDAVEFDYRPRAAYVAHCWWKTRRWCVPSGPSSGAGATAIACWHSVSRPNGRRCTPRISIYGSRRWSATTTP